MADFSRLDALLPQSIVKPGAEIPASQAVPKGEDFSDILKKALSSVNDAQHEAAEATELLLSGKSTDIEGTMIAVEKAGLSLRMMLEVRTKILEAYQEVMRTQL